MNKLRILVVDDDTTFLGIMTAMLARDETLAAEGIACPLRALQRIQEQSFDVLFIDLNMPKMTGAKLLARLAELEFPGKVVLVSAYEKRIIEAVKDFGRELGIQVVTALGKPFDAQAIRQSIFLARQDTQPGWQESPYARDALLPSELIRSGLSADSIALAYQPSWRMMDDSIRIVEALARWRLDDHLVRPSGFMPVIHSEMLIEPFTLLVFDQMLRDLRRLHDKGHLLSGAINMSVHSLGKEQFFEALLALQQQHGVPWNRVVLEFSEKQPFGKISRYLDNLLSLIFMGCRVTLDNFGAGAFSLPLLKQIPFSQIKLDRRFVAGAHIDTSSAAIARNSARMAQDLGMQVVALGGASPEDWEFCRSIGCDYFQGFHKSKPLLLPDLELLLEQSVAAASPP